MPEFKIDAPTPCSSENIQNPYLDRGMYACIKVRRDVKVFVRRLSITLIKLNASMLNMRGNVKMVT